MLNSELNMVFNYEPITYGEIKTTKGDKINSIVVLELLQHVEYGDIYLASACEKLKGKKSFFNEMILYCCVMSFRDFAWI